ncbi:glycosyltransferase family 4 protein [Pseudoxanthomonas wuyuanensis]
MPVDPRPMRILMVLEASYPALRGGGAEAQVRTLARALRARGQRVTIVAPRLKHGLQQKISRVDGVPVCRLIYPRIRLLAGPMMWLAMMRFLYARRHRYDAWHVHIAHHLAAICALFGRWLDKPVLIKVSGWWELEKGTLAAGAGPINRLAYLCLRHAGRWQAISQRIAATLAARGIPASRIAAVPNAVDTARFAGIHRAEDALPRFVFIGRLEAEKGLPALLDAFAAVAPMHPGASLLLVGGGTLEKPLKAAAVRLGIGERVTFAGHCDDIETQLADGNIGVLCSRIEGLSNTLLESMASGLPMVASRISGNEDFVRTGENGWLYDADDSAGLASALSAAAALTPQQRRAMGDHARATVQRMAGLEQVLASLLQLYQREERIVPHAQVSKRSA